MIYSLGEGGHQDHDLPSHIFIIHIEVVPVVAAEYLVEDGVIFLAKIDHLAVIYDTI